MPRRNIPEIVEQQRQETISLWEKREPWDRAKQARINAKLGGYASILETNPEVGDLLCELRAKGLTIMACIAAVGVKKSTFFQWLSFGEEGREPFSSFVLKWEAAEAQMQYDALNVINGAMEGNEAVTDMSLKAATWLLERKFPRDFGKSVVENDVTVTPAPTVDANALAGLTREERRELAGLPREE